MFGIGLIKYKRKLSQDFSVCFSPLKDELGNIPVEIQTNAFANGAIVSICESFLHAQNVLKATSKVLILDAVFEEIYRRESIAVQTRVDDWLAQSDETFLQGYQQAREPHEHDSKLEWLSSYIQQHFEPANNLML